MVIYSEWIRKLSPSACVAVNYVLDKLKSFPGKIVIIGSSVNHKYPMGRDIDIVLVGLGTVKGKKYVRELFMQLSKEFNENLSLLAKGKTAQELKYPLIVDMRHTLDDPEVSEVQELISGHGGTNINIGVRSKALKYDSTFLRDFVSEVKENRSGNTRTWFDIIVDLAYNDDGLENNFSDWEKATINAGNKYIIVPK